MSILYASLFLVVTTHYYHYSLQDQQKIIISKSLGSDAIAVDDGGTEIRWQHVYGTPIIEASLSLFLFPSSIR